MTTTAYFDDGSPGDTISGESVGNSTYANTRPALELQTSSSLIVAQGYLTTGKSMTGTVFTVSVTRQLNVVNPECAYGPDEDPIITPDDSAVWALLLWTGTAFTQVDSGSLALTPAITTVQNFTITSTFTAQTSCWIRFTLHYSTYHVFCQGSVGGTARLTDIRYTATDTGLTCAEGPPPTDGPGSSPFPDPDPNAETDCPCPEFTPAAAETVTFAKASRRAVTYNNNPCGVPLTYLQWSTGEYLVQSNGTYYVRG
jgi:hypothetical protein